MQIPTEEEHELIKMHMIMPFLLDIFQDNINKTKDSQLRFGELFVLHMESLMNKVSQEHAVIRKELLKKGIKVFEQERSNGELRAEYVCRGYKGRKVILMARVKAELQRKIADYLNVDVERLRV